MMETLIKKSKITASILKQCMRTTIDQFNSGGILGWCIFNDRKYIVSSHDGGLVTCFPKPDNVMDTGNNGAGKYTVQVVCRGLVPFVYECKDETERDAIIETFKNVEHDALQKGQFFI